MPTSAERYVSAQNGAVRLALRDLNALWVRTEHLNALARRQALEELWPLIVQRYGELTATIAVDRFETLTGLPGVMAAPVEVEQANARLRWGLDPLWGKAPDVAALARLAQIADELIKKPGRDSLFKSAATHRVRYARVPTGRETCAFCLMLASRGPVYASQSSAGGTKFHGDCDCRIEPVVDDSDLRRLKAEGYDLDGLQDAYRKAREGASSGSPKKILAAMREDEDIH